jgi:copper transport protein
VTRRWRAVVLAVATAVVCLAVPASALAHAALLRTTPSASGTVNGSPARVALTYSEAIEPRFAIISVTDAGGHSQAASPPARSAANPDEIVVPVRHMARGWYLVYWRVISADGHPVRGAFTFAVGPNPGPAPQFVIPSLTESAATPGLLVARWVVFLSMMTAIGLLAFRLAIARPLLRRVPGSSLRATSVGIAVTLAVAIVATLVYVDIATAQFALRSAFDVPALVGLMRSSAFGRGYLDLALVLVLLAVAALVAVRLDDPDREVRSVAALLALIGTGLAAAATLAVPGLSGHAAQYSPRALSLVVDWLHVLSGSLWIGGLVGLILVAASASTRRVAGLVVVVPRFSRVALASVIVLIASGTVASILRLPTLSSLWSTGYGWALVAKITLVVVAMGPAAMNLLRTKPRLEASRNHPTLGESTTALLRRLVGQELVLVIGAVFAAALLTSLAPPPKALAGVGPIAAKVGPGPVTRSVTHGAYRLRFRIAPNQAAVPNAFAVDITKNGAPVTGANVVATFTMLDMEMSPQAYHLDPQAPGTYARRSVPSLVMVGHWGLGFAIAPRGGAPFTVQLEDKAEG